MSYTASLVLTTIFDPIVLQSYFENFQKFGHLDSVIVFVIPDRKTPKTAYERCEQLRKQGLNIFCPTLSEQEAFLLRVGYPPHLIPYDSDNRRNVGYLMALESGTDFLISLDDDNFCRRDEDFFAAHAVVCEEKSQFQIIETDTGWFNVCNLLEFEGGGITYARGFPYYARHQNEQVRTIVDRARIMINAGMWLQDPDVDGISWLVNPKRAAKFKGNSIVLDAKTWSPINTQNTGLHRVVIPSYYFVKMRYPLGGNPIDRYGDIFSGYFSQVCVKHVGGAVRFGTPLTDHSRNTHNYLNDATDEWACILVLEDFLPWLTQEAKLAGSTCRELYTSLSYAIEDAVESFSGRIWTDATRAYFHQMAYHMRLWTAACERIG
jgi:hypothetical protein